jgi:hypothetical protein
MKLGLLLLAVFAIAVIAISPQTRHDIGVPNIAIAMALVAVVVAAVLWNRRT